MAGSPRCSIRPHVALVPRTSEKSTRCVQGSDGLSSCERRGGDGSAAAGDDRSLVVPFSSSLLSAFATIDIVVIAGSQVVVICHDWRCLLHPELPSLCVCRSHARPYVITRLFLNLRSSASSPRPGALRRV